ncbi:uncharacterized protein [Heterodontus francisci]|uniref:uncharacterized protein n=1 Tax=Heterodontus francisci TaxID=7792 RepID=UPI00355B1330
MSALGQDSLHASEIGKSSPLPLQCEEKEKLPLGIDAQLMTENQKASLGTQDDWQPKDMPVATADSTENSGTSEKQNKQTKDKEGYTLTYTTGNCCNEHCTLPSHNKYNRPDSASSYQEKCIEAWKSGSPQTSGHGGAVVKTANDSHKKLPLKDQSRRETSKSVSIISLDSGFTGSCNVEAQSSSPSKSDPICDPQHLQQRRTGRKRISTVNSPSKQTEGSRRQGKPMPRSQRHLFYGRPTEFSANQALNLTAAGLP